MTEIDHTRAKREFWRQHLRMGFWVFTGESISVGFYFASRSPQRSELLGLAVVSALAGIVAIVVLVDRVAARPWRESFSFMWTMASGALTATTVFLDGGFDSPLLVLLPLPVVYAAVAFSPIRVAACGALALVELGVVSGYHSQGSPPGGAMLIWASGGIGLTLLAVTAASNRSRLEQIQRRLVDELEQLASHDGLTGCLNHRAFTERLENEVARAIRHGWPLTVLAADVDDFKGVNDRHGHPAGDAVLAAVADAMRGDLRSGDFVGRMGGDEFALALPHTSMSGGIARAARIQSSLDAAGTVAATLSIGIGVLDNNRPSARDLLEEADRALYHVKSTGRFGIATSDAGEPQRVAETKGLGAVRPLPSKVEHKVS